LADIFTIKTERGKIVITKNAISKIVSNAVNEFEGRVFITNQKGRFFGIAGRIAGLNESGNIEISFSEEGVDIRVFIVVRFGTSIGMVTTKLMDSIHEGVERVMGIEPKSVAVVMAGTISRTMAKRNLEIKKRYDGKR